ARNERVSYIGVIGEREAGAKSLSVRSGKSGELGEIPLDRFKAMLLKEIEEKAVSS
ncbi:MAG: His/Gly/Thr/Pro-type tRNA ligase C-terminal domain-containing protein, partial [Eubacteriales bacterium]|nr:His/Gly/Thr/Pro-type tRNA ligase C-terminal domain-containing protein [Eubacteriales bacterium]